MSEALVSALEAELACVRNEEHALHVRAAHVQSALSRARQGVSEGEVRAMLEARNIIILCRPAVPAGGAS